MPNSESWSVVCIQKGRIETQLVFRQKADRENGLFPVWIARKSLPDKNGGSLTDNLNADQRASEKAIGAKVNHKNADLCSEAG